MSLRFALLALLTSGPLTGYDISRRFHSSVGHVWHAPDSQIYPELRKMEAAGLVEAEAVDDGGRGEKRFYSPTEAGVQALRDWMNAPLRYTYDRYPAHLRAAYLEWAEPDAARRGLLDHIRHHEELLSQFEGQLREIEQGVSDVLNRRLERTAPEDRDRVTAFKRFAYEGLAEKSRQEIAWAERGLRLLDDLG